MSTTPVAENTLPEFVEVAMVASEPDLEVEGEVQVKDSVAAICLESRRREKSVFHPRPEIWTFNQNTISFVCLTGTTRTEYWLG